MHKEFIIIQIPLLIIQLFQKQNSKLHGDILKQNKTLRTIIQILTNHIHNNLIFVVPHQFPFNPEFIREQFLF
jgi:hypothetical protein